MNEPLEKWREIIWRRDLTPEEAAEVERWVALHPDRASEWHLERALAQALRQMPVVEPRPGFTRRVLAVVEQLPSRSRAWWLAWLDRVGTTPVLARRVVIASGLAVVVLVAGAVYYHGHRQKAHLVRTAEVLSKTASALPVTVLADYDVILKLGSIRSGYQPDYELLALLQ